MLWCVDIKNAEGEHFGDIYIKLPLNTVTNYSFTFLIFDDNDFITECVDNAELVRILELGIKINSVKQVRKTDGVGIYETIHVRKCNPTFKNDIKCIDINDEIAKRTGYFNKDFCIANGVSERCKLLKAGSIYCYLDCDNSLNITRSFKNWLQRTVIDGEPNIELRDKLVVDSVSTSFNMVTFLNSPSKSNRTVVVDVLLMVVFKPDLLVGVILEDNLLTINTPMGYYKFTISDKLMNAILKSKLVGRNSIFEV